MTIGSNSVMFLLMNSMNFITFLAVHFDANSEQRVKDNSELQLHALLCAFVVLY